MEEVAAEAGGRVDGDAEGGRVDGDAEGGRVDGGAEGSGGSRGGVQGVWTPPSNLNMNIISV